MDIKLYTIDTSYIDFLRKDPKLQNVFDNKDDTGASVLYNQKTKEAELFPEGSKKPGYLGSVIDFKYAEQAHDCYMSL